MKKKKRSPKLFGLLIIVILIIIGNTALTSFNDHTITATVTDKDTVTSYSKKGGNKHKYYIYCVDENGTEYKFKDANMLIRGKMNSFEMYQDLEVGKTYKFTVVGHKVPIIAPYENILRYEEIK